MSWQPATGEVRMHWLWRSNTVNAQLLRAGLTPLSWAFAGVVMLRNALYDRNILSRSAAKIPVVSVGNLSVGGTGKTPLAAYLARQLGAAGAKPALVMRGVGNDEQRTYDELAPRIPVFVHPDRVRAVAAAARGGADVAVLDDAFQHRRIKRDVDVVVLSADRLHDPVRLLPAGPLREPIANLVRATLVVITRKAASPQDAAQLRERVQRRFPGTAIADVALIPAALVAWVGKRESGLDTLRDQRVLAVAGIGDPAAFFEQLKPLVRELRPLPFADHYAFTPADAALLADCAKGFDAVVCTLKDAVKLGPIWPRQAPELWYVSQRLEVEKGEAEIQRILARLLDLRPTNRL
jgi:tetraacyldisaccharide 4'-kinase